MAKYFRGDPQRSGPDVLTVTCAFLVCEAVMDAQAGSTVARAITDLVMSWAEVVEVSCWWGGRQWGRWGPGYGTMSGELGRKF